MDDLEHAATLEQGRCADAAHDCCRKRAAVAWVAQVGLAALFAYAAALKFFHFVPDGSQALARSLEVGRPVITAIGVVEAVAAVLLLIPRAAAVGALLAAGTMAGALVAHATKVGWSFSDPAGQMWPLAAVGLAASLVVLVARRRELPLIGPTLG